MSPPQATFAFTFFFTKQPNTPYPIFSYQTQTQRAMAAPKSEQSEPVFYYHPVPPDPDPHPQNYVVLPSYVPAGALRHRRSSQWQCRIIYAAALLLLAVAVFFLWPSDPDVGIVRLRLDRMRIHTRPRVDIDILLTLTVKVCNRDVYSIDYRSLDVAIGYRGKRLGHVRLHEGHVEARASSYVNARLDFHGLEVLSDAFFLLQDLSKGVIPFDTVTEVKGQLGLFFFQLPLRAKLSCEVYVSTSNQTIIRQSCYPE